MFRMTVQKTALDIALEARGIVPCSITRAMAVIAMKNGTWDFVLGGASAVGEAIKDKN